MRALAVVLIALTLSGCCCGSCGNKPENFVSDAPATTDEAKKRAKPPDVTVDIERITERSGSGGSCHSAVCLIILPVLVFNAVFPEKYDLVTIKDRGVETFSGTFSTSGRLLSGVVHLEGGAQKQIIAVNLDALGKSIIVESARLEPGAADGGFTLVPTSLQSQHDFLADYRTELETQKKDVDRGDLLAEALKWLDAEALPLVVEHLKDPAEADRAKAAVVTAVCELHDLKPSTHEAAVIAAIGETMGPFTALAALRCADDDARRTGLLTQLVIGACAEKDSTVFHDLNKGAIDATNDRVGLRPALAKAAKVCPPPQAALFALQLREPVDRAGLAELLRTAHTGTALGFVQLDNPTHRAAFFDALGSGDQTERLLEKLDDRIKLTPAELAQLTKAYLVDRIFFSRDPMRGNVLDAMHRHSKGVDTAPARKLITAARDAAKEGDQPVYEVALLVLGDRTRAAAALKGAEFPWADDNPAITSPGQVVNHGLFLSGCTEEESKLGRGKPALSCSGWSKK